MTKREAELKSAFGAELKRQLPYFYTLLHATRAAPDRSITGGGRTTFWEMKHGTPGFESPWNQELMCIRLAHAGYCRYIVWQENARGGNQRTLIVHPDEIRRVVGDSFRRRTWRLNAEAWCDGFDYRWLVDFIRRVHGC